MTCIKSINGKWRFSNEKWALTQTQLCRPKKLLLLEKPRKFLILRYVLIIELSRKPHIKFLDAKLNFEKHLKVVTTKVNKAIGPLQKLHKNLSKTGINDYIKRFLRQHLDYGGVIYDEGYNKAFHQKFELFNIMSA